MEEFSLGFGPKIISRKCSRGTEYVLRALPLGGFVRTKGMEPKADGSESRVENGFYAKGLGSRALVLIAGPLFSILFGYLLFFAGYAAFGEGKPADDPVVGEVIPNKPAAKAGLAEGDRILGVSGQHVSKFNEMKEIIQAFEKKNPNKPVPIEISRGGQAITISVMPVLDKEAVKAGPDFKPVLDSDGKPVIEPQWRIGVWPKIIDVPVSIPTATSLAAQMCWNIISETGRVLAHPKELKENAGGIISIGQAASRVPQEGLPYFMRLAALISVSLGLINLLPIPLMDGGQLLVVGVEALRGGRRLSLRTQEIIGFVGIVLILLMFLSVTFLDIGRLRGN